LNNPKNPSSFVYLKEPVIISSNDRTSCKFIAFTILSPRISEMRAVEYDTFLPTREKSVKGTTAYVTYNKCWLNSEDSEVLGAKKARSATTPCLEREHYARIQRKINRAVVLPEKCRDKAVTNSASSDQKPSIGVNLDFVETIPVFIPSALQIGGFSWAKVPRPR
jgi:hypothetical protein